MARCRRITGRPLRDTDADIVASAGRPISDIFVNDGEPVFRAMERDAVATALIEHDGVLALGGGSILAEQTRAALAGHTVVFLSLTMPTGVKRTGLASNRPLLVGVNPRATYKAMLAARLPMYEEVATLVVQTDDLSVDEVAAVIVREVGSAMSESIAVPEIHSADAVTPAAPVTVRVESGSPV